MAAGLIVGLPRHGKSYMATVHCKVELVDGTRYVVTNLPLDVKKLGQIIEEVYGVTVEPQMWDRLRILTEEETAEFWLYDPEGEINQGVELIKVTQRPWRQKKLKEREGVMVPDFSHRQRPDYPGVLYIIDEAHLFFDAHHWQEIGNDLSYFVSQHGHMRTDILLVTQHPAKLAKRLKLDLEEWTIVENLGRKKLWGGVTVPGWFQRATYAGKPDDPNPGEPEIGRFRLDKRLADCYSTSAGVGLSGRVDTQETKRGKHWSKWLVTVGAGAVAAIVIPLFGLQALGSLVHRGLGGYFDAAQGSARNIATNAAPMVATPPPAAAPVFTPPRVAPPPAVTNKVVGVTPWSLMLDDGRVFKKDDGYRWEQVPGGFYVPSIGLCLWNNDTRGGGGRGQQEATLRVRGSL